MRTTTAIELCLLVPWLTVVTHAAVMDFSTAASGSFLTGSYEQNEIRLTVLSGHYDIWDCNIAPVPCRGIFGLFAGVDAVQTGPSTVRISLANGSAFDLLSVDFPWDPAAPGPQNTLTASNGANFIIVSDPGITLSGPAGFSGITYFDIRSSVDLAGGFVFDNISIAAVPEPTAFPVLAAVLPGLLVYARSKRTWPVRRRQAV